MRMVTGGPSTHPCSGRARWRSWRVLGRSFRAPRRTGSKGIGAEWPPSPRPRYRDLIPLRAIARPLVFVRGLDRPMHPPATLRHSRHLAPWPLARTPSLSCLPSTARPVSTPWRHTAQLLLYRNSSILGIFPEIFWISAVSPRVNLENRVSHLCIRIKSSCKSRN